MKVRMLKDVVSEFPLAIEAPVVAEKGIVYPAIRGKGGAVAVILEDGSRLGVKPGEFEIIEDTP